MENGGIANFKTRINNKQDKSSVDHRQVTPLISCLGQQAHLGRKHHLVTWREVQPRGCFIAVHILMLLLSPVLRSQGYAHPIYIQ